MVNLVNHENEDHHETCKDEHYSDRGEPQVKENASHAKRGQENPDRVINGPFHVFTDHGQLSSRGFFRRSKWLAILYHSPRFIPPSRVAQILSREGGHDSSWSR